MTEIEALKGQFDRLAECCMHEPVWTPDQVSEVLGTVWADVWSGGWRPGPKEESDSTSITAVKLTDGRYGLLEESEDYTGHGCRCSSSTNAYDSLAELLQMGVVGDDAQLALRSVMG